MALHQLPHPLPRIQLRSKRRPNDPHIHIRTHTHTHSLSIRKTNAPQMGAVVHSPSCNYTLSTRVLRICLTIRTLRSKRKTSPEHHLSWHATTKNHPAPELQLKIPSLNVMGTIFITIALTHDKKHRTFRCFCISKAYTNLKKKTHSQTNQSFAQIYHDAHFAFALSNYLVTNLWRT